MRDEYAIVLDFLPTGYPTDTTQQPIAILLGEDNFAFLEAIPKEGVTLEPGERVYIGKGERDKIRTVRRRLSYSDLTGAAQAELEEAVERIVTEKEQKYVDFYNKSRPVSTRQHQLELLPGIGKKHMWEIINERQKKPFESFEDIKKRVKLLPHPKKTIVNKILEELRGETDKYLFTRPPPEPRHTRRYHRY